MTVGAARAGTADRVNRPLAVSAVLAVASIVGAQIGAVLGLRRRPATAGAAPRLAASPAAPWRRGPKHRWRGPNQQCGPGRRPSTRGDVVAPRDGADTARQAGDVGGGGMTPTGDGHGTSRRRGAARRQWDGSAR